MNEAVRRFAVDILGCGCPEEVFSSVRLEVGPVPCGGIRPLFTIRIGGRLMVVGVDGESLRPPRDALVGLVATGTKMRDGEGFNRLRICVVTDDPVSDAMLRPLFNGIRGSDDRIHLHVVKGREIAPLLEGGSQRREHMEKLKTEPTVWHEMEGPFIGGREHYQEKSYGFTPLWETEKSGESPEPGEEGK